MGGMCGFCRGRVPCTGRVCCCTRPRCTNAIQPPTPITPNHQQEKKEAALLEAKTRLWEAEAQAKLLEGRVGDLTRVAEGRERDRLRAQQQVEELTRRLEESHRAARRLRHERQEAERARGGRGEGGGGEGEREGGLLLAAELRETRVEAEGLRGRVAALEGELCKARRKQRQQQLKLQQVEEEGEEEGLLAAENARLRAAVADMRRAMEERVARGGTRRGGEKEEEEEGGRLGGMLLAENRRLREENRKLAHTCVRMGCGCLGVKFRWYVHPFTRSRIHDRTS